MIDVQNRSAGDVGAPIGFQGKGNPVRFPGGSWGDTWAQQVKVLLTGFFWGAHQCWSGGDLTAHPPSLPCSHPGVIQSSMANASPPSFPPTSSDHMITSTLRTATSCQGSSTRSTWPNVRVAGLPGIFRGRNKGFSLSHLLCGVVRGGSGGHGSFFLQSPALL